MDASLGTTMAATAMSTVAQLNVTQPDIDYLRASSFRYFGICVAIWAIFVGSIGNLLTILAFFSNSKLRTTFNVFIVNLSIVDFLTASLMLPFNLAGYVQMAWPFGPYDFTARFQAFSYFCCGYTSVVFLVAITVNRFIGVVKPGKYNDYFNKQRVICILVFCWTFAPICLIPMLTTHPICAIQNPSNPTHSITGFHPKQFICTFVCVPWDEYMQVARAMFQFLPLVIMVVLYSIIFARLDRQRERIHATMRKGRSASNVTGINSVSVSEASPTKSVSTDQNKRSASIVKDKNNLRKSIMMRKTSSADMSNAKRIKDNRRMLLISVTICIGFMITFLPSVIVNLPPSATRRAFDVRVHMAASNMAWFNSSINPIIYVLLNRRFRKEYKRLVLMFFGRVRGSFMHDSLSTTTPQQKHKVGINVSMQPSA
ncbi:G-protein coupled receptor 84-like [Ciona intestinalis]